MDLINLVNLKLEDIQPSPHLNLSANLSHPLFRVITLVVPRYHVHSIFRQSAKELSGGQTTGQTTAH